MFIFNLFVFFRKTDSTLFHLHSLNIYFAEDDDIFSRGFNISLEQNEGEEFLMEMN